MAGSGFPSHPPRGSKGIQQGSQVARLLSPGFSSWRSKYKPRPGQAKVAGKVCGCSQCLLSGRALSLQSPCPPWGSRDGPRGQRASGGTPVPHRNVRDGVGIGSCSHTGAVGAQAQPKGFQGEPRVGFRAGSPTGIRQCQGRVQLGVFGYCIPLCQLPSATARAGPTVHPQSHFGVYPGAVSPHSPHSLHSPIPHSRGLCGGKFAEHFLPCPHGH